eukprot:303487-Pelagomonas_calceolata.AAC.1
MPCTAASHGESLDVFKTLNQSREHWDQESTLERRHMHMFKCGWVCVGVKVGGRASGWMGMGVGLTCWEVAFTRSCMPWMSPCVQHTRKTRAALFTGAVYMRAHAHARAR